MVFVGWVVCWRYLGRFVGLCVLRLWRLVYCCLNWYGGCLVVWVVLICFCFNSVGGYLFCFACGFNCVMLLLGGFMVDSVLC